MSYLAFARKYRPQKFADVIGQKAVVQTLQNALAQGRLHHAYLFTGPRGVGKTTIARLLAKAMNCENGPASEPCQKCSSCTNISDGSSLAVSEIDGASNTGVDDIRQIREQVKYLTPGGRYRIYIIDEVHMLSTPAFNALLKTLEEPPSHVIFMFATTEPHKIPATILSRCQRHDLKRISASLISASIKAIANSEDISIDDDALMLIAEEADGSLRDSQSLFDQAVAYCGKAVSSQAVLEMLGATDRAAVNAIVDAVANGDCVTALQKCDAIYERGVDLSRLASDLLRTFRHLLILSATFGSQSAADVPAFDRQRLEALARKRPLSAWQQAFNIAYGFCGEVARSALPRASLEAAVIKLCQIEDVSPLGDIISDLDSRILATGKSVEQSTANVCAAARTSSEETTSRAQATKASSLGNSPEDAIARWGDFCVWLAKKEPSMAAIVKNCSPALDGTSVELVFESPFHSAMLQEDDRRQKMLSALSEFFGRTVDFTTKCASKAQSAGGDESKNAKHDEFIKNAKEILGAAVENTKVKR